MGGSRPPPPKPPGLPPISSKAKDYSMDRPSEVQNELDDLRNRGIAKVLNRHFTDTTKKLAKEKAAADAALADLERRRANTSHFVPSKGGELNPFDSMYVELQQKRAECRRKERETMLLYQRYVYKYGGKAASKSSALSGNTRTPSNAAALAAEELSPATSSSSTPEVPPPPSPLPTRATLQPLDENWEAEGTIDSDINFSRFYNKQIQKNQAPSRSKDPPSKQGPGFGKDNDASLKAPEMEELTPQASRESHILVNDPPDLAWETPRKTNEDSEGEVNPSRAMSKSDPPADPPAVKFAKDTAEKTTPKAQNVDPESRNSRFDWGKALFPSKQETDEESAARSVDDEAEDGDEVGSTVATTMPVETNIKAATDRMEICSDTSDSNRPAREVMAEVPTPTAATFEEEDDRSIISGLTMNSHVTRQVMEEIEQEMTQFLNTETEAIRKMLDEEEERNEGSGVMNSSLSVVGDESRRASMKAEAMAKEMQKILNEYGKEDHSSSAHDTEETEVDTETVATTSGYPRKYVTSDPTEDWMVYYDESFQREYYFETNSKTTQWELPGSSRSTIEPRLFSEDVAPTASFKRTRSRRDVYRKKIRKRRMRRAVAFMFVLLCFGGTVYHWHAKYPESSYQESIVAGWQSTTASLVDVFDTSLYAIADGMESTATYVKDQFEYAFTDRKRREEAEEAARLEEMERIRKVQEALAAEQERERLEEERKAAEAQKLKDEKEREKAKREETQKQEQEPQATGASNGAEEEAEAGKRRPDKEHKALQRPWGCFLPLSYIHPRCNRLAKDRPICKDSDILNSFLQ